MFRSRNYIFILYRCTHALQFCTKRCTRDRYGLSIVASPVLFMINSRVIGNGTTIGRFTFERSRIFYILLWSSLTPTVESTSSVLVGGEKVMHVIGFVDDILYRVLSV